MQCHPEEGLIERQRKKVTMRQAAVDRLTSLQDGVPNHPTEGDKEAEIQEANQPTPHASIKVLNERLQEAGRTVEGRALNKWARTRDDVVQTYAPKWGVLTTDHICYGIMRGLMLSADLSLYTSASPVEACMKIMSLMSLVSFTTFIFFSFSL